jgi:hypothetical protein
VSGERALVEKDKGISSPWECEKINFPPPPCPSPVKGEGISLLISIFFPSPLAERGG